MLVQLRYNFLTLSPGGADREISHGGADGNVLSNDRLPKGNGIDQGSGAVHGYVRIIPGFDIQAGIIETGSGGCLENI